ncbi:MAG: 50S ribosomal protein L10 [Actinobacteria bacterium]|uniref:Unannotated protein n=1 Tax=freshwater metagenome TaxID=449393 RepID=A0A6J7JB28_9ZZZZ|nr:50S ribosomal protein L10 [Actinomycetota bacterium]
MAGANKANTVAELAEQFRTSSATVLTEYRGLTVAQLKKLRRSLGPTVSYTVVKNTLTKIAAKEAGVTGLDDLLAGPSAIAFVKGDPVDAAKGIRNFAKENPNLVIKGGVMYGVVLAAADIQKLADLESREVLLAKLAGAMKAKQSQAAALFAAPLSKTARALGALQTKLESQAPAAAAPAAVVEELAVEEVAAEEVVADEAATDAILTEEIAETVADEAAVEESTEG